MGRKSLNNINLELISEIIKNRDDIDLASLIEKAKSKYNNIKSEDYNRFESAEELAIWWATQFVKQDGRCCYCETPIKDIRFLINSKKLKTRAGKGESTRGNQLEIERLDTNENLYSKENCMLACYYCNNDKSDIFPHEDFKKYFGKAKNEYFKYLLSTFS